MIGTLPVMDPGGGGTAHSPMTTNSPGHQSTSITRPRILLTGLRRSGKTSIQRVIFTKMQPSQTQFLESTPHLTLNQFSCGSFINFQVQELPGQLHMFPSTHSGSVIGPSSSPYDDDTMSGWVGGGYDMERLLIQCHAVVYVIDAQDDYSESITRLTLIIQMGRRVNPKIRYEVFIHKVDQLPEEAKNETQRDIHNQVKDRLGDPTGGNDSWLSINSQDILINFHLTSIFDHSIFEAFSKVIQKLLPQFSHLERLLNLLLQTSNIEQAFLFDVQTKISIATDSSPTDMQMYELCCDMIDLLINMSEIYGQPNGDARSVVDEDDNEDDENVGEEGDSDGDESQQLQDDESEYPYPNGPANGLGPSGDTPFTNSPLGTTPVTNSTTTLGTTSEPASAVFDSMSSSVIKLTGGRALYLKEINRHLALICVLREEALTKQAIIDYNVKQLKKSIIHLFRFNNNQATRSPPTSSVVNSDIIH